MSHEWSALITKLIRDFVAETTPDPLNLRQLAAEKQVLPLTWDWGGVLTTNTTGDIISFPFSLDANGDFVAFPFDASDYVASVRVEDNPRIRNIALFQGSKKYLELKEFVPAKPDGARTCSACQGTGIDSYAAMLNGDAIVCYCGGVGWIP